MSQYFYLKDWCGVAVGGRETEIPVGCGRRRVDLGEGRFLHPVNFELGNTCRAVAYLDCRTYVNTMALI